MMPRPSSDNMNDTYAGQPAAQPNPNQQQQQQQQQRQNFSGAGQFPASGMAASSQPNQAPPMDSNVAAGGSFAGTFRGQQDNLAGVQSPNPTAAVMQGLPPSYAANTMNLPELSPQLMRMQMNQMYAASAQGMGVSGNSPNFASAMQDPMDLSLSGRSMGAGGTGTGGAQADREEELLLNLLIARRQRGRMSGDNAPAAGGGSGGNQSLADELMRLRQSRGMGGGGSARGGGMPSVPGMPPLFDNPMVGGMGPTSTYDAYMQAQGVGDMSERIDRQPRGLLDARSQEMQDLSGRGMKRGQYFPTGAVMGQGFAQSPPAKKKRAHKKKPSDMPRRPLSAYNLFFSEERVRILKEVEDKEGEGGEESKSETQSEAGEPETKEAAEDSSKPAAMQRPLVPSQKKRRPHRKTHGKISFQQLARMVGDRWKKLDPERKKYYQGLAEEDMKRQKIAMEEYYRKQNEKGAAKEEPSAGGATPGGDGAPSAEATI